MALAIKELQVTDLLGNVLPGASVLVQRDVAGSPVASIFSDRAGVTPKDNPFTADAITGIAAFYAAGGAYKVTITSGTYSRILRYVAVGTAAEADLAALSDVDALSGTSTTSVAIGTGSKAFTTQTGKNFNVGRDLKITSDADPTVDYMAGVVTAYNADTGALTILVSSAAGSGTHTDWTIRLSGVPGPTGAIGPAAFPDRTARAMDTTDSNPASSGYTDGASIGGVTVATGDLVLRNSSSNQSRNGIWVVAASGAAARDDDFDTWAEVVAATLIAVQEGTYADTLWQPTANAGGTLDTTAITFKQVNADASNTVPGVVKVSTSGTAATGSATDEALRVADAAANFIGQGLHEIGYWPARAMKVSATSGATALASAESSSNKLNTEYLSFANAATQYAEFSFRAPKKMDPASTFIVEFEWMEAAGASAHVCRWQAEMQGQGDGDTVDSAWGTAVAVDDTGTSGTRRFIATAAVTPGGSPAQGDKFLVRVARLGGHGNDTLDVAAYLIGVTLFASINLKNDA